MSNLVTRWRQNDGKLRHNFKIYGKSNVGIIIQTFFGEKYALRVSAGIALPWQCIWFLVENVVMTHPQQLEAVALITSTCLCSDKNSIDCRLQPVLNITYVPVCQQNVKDTGTHSGLQVFHN